MTKVLSNQEDLKAQMTEMKVQLSQIETILKRSAAKSEIASKCRDYFKGKGNSESSTVEEATKPL